MYDIEKIRKETFGVEERIFMNSAGSSLMPIPVLNSIQEYLLQEANYGGYAIMQSRHELIEGFYKEAAKLINTRSENIAFAFSATDAFAKALSSFSFTNKDHILITSIDYVSNYLYIIALKERYGLQVHILKNNENGELDLDDLQLKIRKYMPRVVSITHVPTNSGLIQDVEAVGEICSNYPDVVYILDACQSMGQLEVDVQKIKCDFLTTSGRKFLRGPRGTGFLYVSDRILEQGVKPLSSDAYGSDWTGPLSYTSKPSALRYEYFEKPYASMVGLGKACAYINNIGIKEIEKIGNSLSHKLRNNLSEIPGIKLLDKGNDLSNIITFVKQGKSKGDSIHYFSERNVVCGITERFSALIDFEDKGLSWAVRVSPHYFNTPDEVDAVSNLIAEM